MLAVPPHTPAREDELSIVLEGEIGVHVGDAVYTAGPGVARHGNEPPIVTELSQGIVMQMSQPSAGTAHTALSMPQA